MNRAFACVRAPLNISFLLALVMAYLVWLLIWRTKLGYEMRTFGFSPKAARYAGISESRITIVAMLISGGLAGDDGAQPDQLATISAWRSTSSPAPASSA